MILQRLAKYDFHEMTFVRLFMQKTDNRALSPKYCRTLSYVPVFFFRLVLVETTVFHCRTHHSVISLVAALIEAHPALYETTYWRLDSISDYGSPTSSTSASVISHINWLVHWRAESYMFVVFLNPR